MYGIHVQENLKKFSLKYPILKNMPVTLWLSWKHEIPRKMTCQIKLLPD